MRREIIVAVVFGVILGLLVAAGMVIWLRSVDPQKAAQISVAELTPKAKNKASSIQPLEITQPADGSIVKDKEVTIKGKASKDGLIVIQSPIKDVILQNKKGNFSVDFPLALGENIIAVAVYPKTSRLAPQQKIIKVNYLDE